MRIVGAVFVIVLATISTPAMATRVEYPIERVDAARDVVSPDNVAEGFVKIESGLSSLSHLKIMATRDRGDSTPRKFYYKFTYKNSKSEKKSRLELATCYINETIYRELVATSPVYFTSPLRLPAMFHVYCEPANRPEDDIHFVQYDVNMRAHKGLSSILVVTQWHDTPDPRIIKYGDDIPIEISTEALYQLCSGSAKCTKGEVIHANGTKSPIRFQQGGYPPLTLKLRNGNLTVTARSDDRFFTPKGGCPSKSGDQCENYPRQQYHVLLNKPKSELMGKMATWKWAIKWSTYGLKCCSKHTDPGILKSNAWIRLWVNGVKEIDWVGPCGVNSQGRIPYFKFGIYNPSGSAADAKINMESFKEWSIPAAKLGKEQQAKIATLDLGIPDSRLMSDSTYKAVASAVMRSNNRNADPLLSGIDV